MRPMFFQFDAFAHAALGGLSIYALAGALVVGLASSTPAAAECRHPIRVPVSQGFGISLDIEKRALGRYGSVLAEVEQQTKCKIEYVQVSRARAWSMFLQGDVDLITTATRTDERDQVGELLVFNTSRIAAISLKSHSAEIGNIGADLNGHYLVFSVRGTDFGPAYQKLVNSLRAQKRMEFVAQGKIAMEMLKLGRVDVVLASPVTIWEAAQAAGISNDLRIIFIDAIPPFYSGVYLSQKSLSQEDFAQIKNSLTPPRQKKLFWRTFLKEAPAWAMSGASLAE